MTGGGYSFTTADRVLNHGASHDDARAPFRAQLFASAPLLDAGNNDGLLENAENAEFQIGASFFG